MRLCVHDSCSWGRETWRVHLQGDPQSAIVDVSVWECGSVLSPPGPAMAMVEEVEEQVEKREESEAAEGQHWCCGQEVAARQAGHKQVAG